MKKFLRGLFTVLFVILAVTPQMVANGLSPFGVNDAIDPTQGTATSSDIFQDTATLEKMEDVESGDFIAPAWLEILVLVSPANFPISTFLTQKTLDGIRGLAKAEAASYAGKNNGALPDYLIKTDDGKTRFNQKYAVPKDYMNNCKQFSNEAVSNYKLKWGQIAVLPFQDTITTAIDGGSTTADLVVSNIKMWKRGATMKVQNSTYATSGDPLILYVNEVAASTSTVSVYSTGTNGTEAIPAITADTQVTRMGTASAETAVKAAAVTTTPTTDYNYAQKFITSVVYSNWLMMTQLFTNYSFSLITNLALQDFRYSQELAFMFGNRSIITVTAPTSGDDERIIMTGGLTHFIDQEIEYGTGDSDTTIEESDIVDFTKEMRVGNNGSDTRYLFAGSELISALNKGVMSDSTRFVQKDYDSVYGLSFTCLYSFFGTINVMYAPLMDQSEFINQGFLLDMQFIDKFVYQPFRETRVDLWKLRESDAQSIDMVEAAGLIARNLDCHFIMKVKE